MDARSSRNTIISGNWLNYVCRGTQQLMIKNMLLAVLANPDLDSFLPIATSIEDFISSIVGTSSSAAFVPNLVICSSCIMQASNELFDLKTECYFTCTSTLIDVNSALPYHSSSLFICFQGRGNFLSV
jgi:hypothetical protein